MIGLAKSLTFGPEERMVLNNERKKIKKKRKKEGRKREGKIMHFPLPFYFTSPPPPVFLLAFDFTIF